MSSAEFRVTDPAAADRAADPIVARVAAEVADAAAGLTPHRTGRLAAGWQVTGSSGKYRVVNTVPYARFVEYGTRRNRPAAMLGRAAADARARYGR